MTNLAGYSTILLRPWPESPGARTGVSPHAPYVDRYWMPLLGPVPTCLARLLTRVMQQETGSVRVPVPELAVGLGLPLAATWDHLAPALEALEQAGIVSMAPDGVVHVRPELPHLRPEQVAELPLGLQVAHRSAFALRAEAAPGGRVPPLQPNARLLSLAATVEEVVTDPELQPRQLAYRFQHVVRLAEEARDEAVLDWAAPDLETTLAECQLTAQGLSEAIWATQHEVASHGHLPERSRAGLSEAAAALIDWVVAEFPPGTDAWVLDDHDL